ncbi:hypothetical protein [Gallaecimonas pentaromativorans]|uniref:Uncharacterized protein n=1 Tax=Gallaecimonas pentaromativorans TaxID=584787 RepID=A0A3N1P9P7_9GAMM|nr:hypothetical protein [Gallaecimonas pentaromativorans]ROQ28724.1 hypothetical protein EDC28_103318 [Gallaecimonas pentaromativorans]
MSREFYGPTANAEIFINRLLGLPATGKEQDWEFELADPKKIDEILNALESKGLDFELQSALSLLLISSIEEASDLDIINDVQLDRARKFFFDNTEVRERMSFYWLELDRAADKTLVRRLISCSQF